MRRAITALVLVPLVLLLVYRAGALHYAVAIGSVSLLALGEFFALAEKAACRSFKPIGYLGAAAITFSFHQDNFAIDYAIICLLLASFALALKENLSEALKAIAVTFLGAFYTSYLLGLLIPIRFGFGQGKEYTLFLLATVWSGDTGAYLVGSRWGRTKLAPSISPRKTIEGAIAGLASSALAAVIFRSFALEQLGWLEAIALSLALGFMSQVGDLAESILKRAAKVKDSSALLPGHGGVLDRIDGLLFAAPTMYVYLRICRPQ